MKRIKGINKADAIQALTFTLETINFTEIRNRPCVFLSHKKEDKPACRTIAKYLSDAEIDYFLDEESAELQSAVFSGNANKITENIKKGIAESTHMLVLVSEKTYKSQWVPFEVGYGHSTIIEATSNTDNSKLSILTLKDIAEKELPTFMQIGNILKGTKSLNSYISIISNQLEKSMINETRMFSHYQLNHPLDNVLNWKL
ncbi:toll/interleukin-1 receptor domain-containing protein [Algibacter sp. L1A34]|uniref:toll/interleukin-1 receptor domain-containing protein n=1 Tax=Algibacter sp. L1A34 TaxID=2686365 RepID=UPI00131ACF17|nr:toll/interleukin-1 receptor domain-containing protein [Algibacter sp. L1A34]